MKIKARRTLKGRGKPEEASVLLALKVEDRVMSQDKQVASKFSSVVWKKKLLCQPTFDFRPHLKQRTLVALSH